MELEWSEHLSGHRSWEQSPPKKNLVLGPVHVYVADDPDLITK